MLSCLGYLANWLEELALKLNQTELESRSRAEETKRLAEKITTLESQVRNLHLQENQRKEELLTKERNIQSLSVEKMEIQNEVKVLQQNLEDERNTILRIKASKSKQRDQEVQQQQELDKHLMEQTKYASFNHSIVLENQSKQIQ